MTKLSRRDFLKLTSAISMSAQVSSWLPGVMNGNSHSNVLILLFDTMSARHLSLHGYPRETTPELSRFAARATVYHAHYSASNFTSPSTASMFLGMYPWKHRAHNQAGLVRRDLVSQNLFALLGTDYYRFSYTQTEWANTLMQQFADSIDRSLPPSAFSVNASHLFTNPLPSERLLLSFSPGTLLGQYAAVANQIRIGDYYQTAFPEYPKGPPVISDNNVMFRLKDVFDGVFQEIRDASTKSMPHVSYCHLYAPHGSYRPARDFTGLFKDRYRPVMKPNHPLSDEEGYESLVADRQRYDQYIANVDHEFGVLIDRLEEDGLLQDTYVIITSDHGELLERGTIGHAVPLMFDSVIRIPLLIRAPGQSMRTDIYSPTSNIDVLPTLLSLFDQQIPSNLDGRLLPGFGGQEDASRDLYSMYSPKASAFGPLQAGTFVLQQGPYKLIHYRGYEEYPEAFELYNLHEDPDELHDLISKETRVANQMQEQLLDALRTADERYE